jgi:O6-methylguanine-DNA--protein-cysteine methyltransferase
MRKTFFALLAFSVLTFSACSDTKDKTKDKDKQEETDEDDKKGKDSDDEESDADYKKAAVAYCECFNDGMENVNATLKKIIIKASKTDDPQQTMKEEMMGIEDAEEKQAVVTDAQKLNDMGDVEACTKKIDKKYGVKENDKKAQKKILQALEEESDCKVVAALMRIALSTKGH